MITTVFNKFKNKNVDNIDKASCNECLIVRLIPFFAVSIFVLFLFFDKPLANTDYLSANDAQNVVLANMNIGIKDITNLQLNVENNILTKKAEYIIAFNSAENCHNGVVKVNAETSKFEIVESKICEKNLASNSESK